MIYFFHHYELPVIIQQAQVQQILRLRTRQRHQQQNGNGAPTNNASNLRNGSNTIGNQANNNNAMGGAGGGVGVGVGGGVGNQMNNNNGVGGNNNNPLNNNNRTLFAIISLIMNVQVITIMLNPILNALGAVQGRLINYAFGTAAFSNNNNDNRLNNNNITNNNRNNNNNPSMNFTRLRINLSRLRRINLAGIQINPAADGVLSNVNAERGENVNGDDDVVGGSDADNANSSVVVGSAANASSPTEVDAAGSSMRIECSSTVVEDDHHHHELSQPPPPPTSDFDMDFDIIDANDEIEIKSNDLQLNVGRPMAENIVTKAMENDPLDGLPRDQHSNAPIITTTTAAPSLSCDIKIQPVSNMSNNEPMDNATSDSIDRSNHLMAFDESPSDANDGCEQKLQRRRSSRPTNDGIDDNDDLCYQISSSKGCSNEINHWKQQQSDNQDNSLSNTFATFEQAGQANCSLSSATVQKSDAILCATQASDMSAANKMPTVDSISNLTAEENRTLVVKNVDLSDNETKID